MKPTNYAAGHTAEQVAAEYLAEHGFTVLQLNWRTKRCEIDIVANKDGSVYFIEVKSRRTGGQGYGYDYITPKKLQQMRFAAELWVAAHHWRGQYQLAVISIDGATMTLITEL